MIETATVPGSLAHRPQRGRLRVVHPVAERERAGERLRARVEDDVVGARQRQHRAGDGRISPKLSKYGLS